MTFRQYASAMTAEANACRGDYVLFDTVTKKFVVMTESERDARMNERLPIGGSYRYITWTRKR